MKKVVLTIALGDFKSIATITHPIIKRYADRIGADFMVINEKKIASIPQYEKFQIYDLFTKQKYDRILYVDTDILIRDDCPDLFDIVPEDHIGAFNEGKYINALEILRSACRRYREAIPKWEGQYYNTGVLVLSYQHRFLFKTKPKEYIELAECDHYEQPFLNIKLINKGYPIKNIGYIFNHINIIDKILGKNHLSSFIIHYARIGNIKERLELIKEDLETWRNSSDYKFPSIININIDGGMGDQVASEPVLRYICITHPNDDIFVKTKYPELFKHLPIVIVNEFSNDAPIIEMQPSPDKPIWKFLPQSLCHPTDFASVSALRKILPDINKTIKLQVDDEAIKSLQNKIGGIKLEDLVVIHPGKGWESKTFPVDYWQQIIDNISKNVKVAIIGKNISNSQGTVDVKCPNDAIDLRDNLNLEELIALISKARILISNDSSPIHIAGAFDNWIVLIPTCKHPDHVLPIRYGSRLYKTISLYKKLMCEEFDTSNLSEDTLNTVKGNILDYLPDVVEIENAVYNILKREQ